MTGKTISFLFSFIPLTILFLFLFSVIASSLLLPVLPIVVPHPFHPTTTVPTPLFIRSSTSLSSSFLSFICASHCRAYSLSFLPLLYVITVPSPLFIRSSSSLSVSSLPFIYASHRHSWPPFFLTHLYVKSSLLSTSFSPSYPLPVPFIYSFIRIPFPFSSSLLHVKTVPSPAFFYRFSTSLSPSLLSPYSLPIPFICPSYQHLSAS
jgi:hypothetical protein